MLNFDFHNPTHIAFGKGRVADLAKLRRDGSAFEHALQSTEQLLGRAAA